MGGMRVSENSWSLHHVLFRRGVLDWVWPVVSSCVVAFPLPLTIWANDTLGGDPELEGDVLIDCGTLLGDSSG